MRAAEPGSVDARPHHASKRHQVAGVGRAERIREDGGEISIEAERKSLRLELCGVEFFNRIWIRRIGVVLRIAAAAELDVAPGGAEVAQLQTLTIRRRLDGSIAGCRRR